MWNFFESPECEVLTTRAVLEGDAPILFVRHSPITTEHWVFFEDDDPDGPIEAVTLQEILELEPELEELSDLPLGWVVTREEPDGDWEASPFLPTDWDALCEAAREELMATQSEVMEEYELGSWERYHYDLADNRFVWIHNGEEVMEADLQIVGSYSQATQTWLWAWGNGHLPEASNWMLAVVQQFGVENDLDRLTEAKWETESEDAGWLMAAIARYLLDNQMAYRVPLEEGAVFFVLDDIRWLS